MAHGLVHAHARDGRTGSDGEEVGRRGGGARFDPVLPYVLSLDVKVKKLFRESSLGQGTFSDDITTSSLLLSLLNQYLSVRFAGVLPF